MDPHTCSIQLSNTRPCYAIKSGTLLLLLLNTALLWPCIVKLMGLFVKVRLGEDKDVVPVFVDDVVPVFDTLMPDVDRVVILSLILMIRIGRR